MPQMYWRILHPNWDGWSPGTSSKKRVIKQQMDGSQCACWDAWDTWERVRAENVAGHRVRQNLRKKANLKKMGFTDKQQAQDAVRQVSCVERGFAQAMSYEGVNKFKELMLKEDNEE